MQPGQVSVKFQLPRHTLAAMLSTLDQTTISPLFFNADGSINSDCAFARRFTFSLGLLICCKRSIAVGGVVVQVQGDGNCLARALSVALYGNEGSYETIRLLYAGGVLCCPELQAFVPDFERRRYIADHFPGGPAWGGNVELDAISRIFGLNVFLITDSRTCAVVEVCRHGHIGICLLYHGRNHYDLLGFPAETGGNLVRPSQVMGFAGVEPQPHEVRVQIRDKRTHADEDLQEEEDEEDGDP